MPQSTKSKIAVLGSSSAALPEVVIGKLVGIDETGMPLVDYPANPAGMPLGALCTARFDDRAIGRSAALLFADGDPARPLIIGLIHDPLEDPRESVPEDRAAVPTSLDIKADGERVVLEAEKEIVLTCGRASLTLTRAGKILLRGAYLLSRSSGVNRIKGGSVQIN